MCPWRGEHLMRRRNRRYLLVCKWNWEKVCMLLRPYRRRTLAGKRIQRPQKVVYVETRMGRESNKKGVISFDRSLSVAHFKLKGEGARSNCDRYADEEIKHKLLSGSCVLLFSDTSYFSLDELLCWMPCYE